MTGCGEREILAIVAPPLASAIRDSIPLTRARMHCAISRAPLLRGNTVVAFDKTECDYR